MREVKVNSFFQREKTGNDLENSWEVFYCSEHKEEAQKKPNKWTEEDSETWYKRKQQKHQQEIDQGKREIREKLNNQKNLFCCEGRTDENKEGQKYAAFLGRQNGQNYYLMIPTSHPIRKSTDPAIKKVADCIFLDEGGYLFTVDGVENIPLEKAPLGYWNYWPKDIIFHKIVGLNDKITIAEFKEKQGKPEKDQTGENKSGDKPTKSLAEIRQILLQYFQNKKIKKVIWNKDKGDLIVEYENNHVSTHHSIENIDISKGFPELHEARSYLIKNNKNEITLSELLANDNSVNVTTENPQNSKVILWLSLSGILLVFSGVIVWRILKKRKVRKAVN